MRKQIKRLLSFILIFSFVFSGFSGISASAKTYTDLSFPFTVEIGTGNDKHFSGEFFKDDRTLYISGKTLEKFEGVKATSTGFKRSDGVVYNPTSDKILEFDGNTYYLFTDAMTSLCFTTRYYTSTSRLAVVPTRNVWSISETGNEATSNPYFKLYGWTGVDYMGEEFDTYDAVAYSITLNLFTKTKKIIERRQASQSYKHYRQALWDIMLPEADLETLADIYSKNSSGIKYVEIGTGAAKDGTIVKEYSEAIKRITAPIDIMSLADFTQNIEFYANIANIDQSISNAIMLIDLHSPTSNANISKALNDTIDLYEKNLSPFDLYLESVADNGLSFIEDLFLDTDLEKLKTPAAIMAIKSGCDQVSKDFYDNSLRKSIEIASANITIQELIKQSYNSQNSAYTKGKTLPDKLSHLENMRDLLIVYLLAGHNAWNALSEMEEYPEAKEMMRVMTDEIDNLRAFSYIDFETYDRALEAKEALLAVASSRDFSTYSLSWNANVAEKIGGVDVTLEGADEKGRAFDYKFNFSHYYYLKNGMAAGFIRTGTGDDSGRSVQVYDFDGHCEIVIKPKKAKANIEDIKLVVTENLVNEYDASDLEKYLEKTKDGTTIYRIPVPMDGSPSKDPTPKPTEKETTTENVPDAESNQVVLSTNFADYRISYDTKLFIVSKSSYGSGLQTKIVDSLKESVKFGFTSTTFNLSASYMDADFYYNEMRASYTADNNGGEVDGREFGPMKSVNIGGGLTAVYFDITYTSIKDPNLTMHTNRHFYIDFGNGEGIYGQDGCAFMNQDVLGISYDEYLQSIFKDVEIFQKADVPYSQKTGKAKISSDNADYEITFNPEIIRLNTGGTTGKGIFIRNKNGVPGVLDVNLQDIFNLSSSYNSPDDYLKKQADWYQNTYKFAENVVIGETKEFKVGEYTAKYFTLSYYNNGQKVQFNDICCLAIDLCNGDIICGDEKIASLYGKQIGLTSEDIVKNAFKEIKIIEK